MATVLCFGDSLTWGLDPDSGARYPRERCWPRVMHSLLEPPTRVLVDGLPGRTTVTDSPFVAGRNGASALRPVLETHTPLDLVIIMLGTNDLQIPLGLSARHAASGLWTLLDIVLRSRSNPQGQSPASLVVAPPPLRDPRGFLGIFLEGRESESEQLPHYYELIAAQMGAAFYDAGAVTGPSAADGIHLDLAGHAALGAALAPIVTSLLPT